MPEQERTASSPVVGARRGTVVGVVATTAATAAMTKAPEGMEEVAAVATGAAAAGILTSLGKWARDKGGLWGALLGWLV